MPSSSKLADATDYLLIITGGLASRVACRELILDPKFQAASASSSSTHEHHVGEGGLLLHTYEVVRLCGVMAQAAVVFKPQVREDVLITAATFHDAMKMRDYELQEIPADKDKPAQVKWVKTNYGKRIYHVAGSYAYWCQVAAKHGFSQQFIDDVGHCILAHHGRLEFGSPVVPQSIEAKILNCADGLSAEYGFSK